MTNKLILIPIIAGLTATISCPGFSAELASTRLSLVEVESATLQSSPQLKSAEKEYEAAIHKAYAQRSAMSPKLSLEGSYRYQSVVPEFSPIPNGPVTKFGDNQNYSYGPQATWTLFASGNLRERWKSGEASARAARSAWDAALRKAQLDARLAYLKVRLGLEHVHLITDSLKLEEAQYRDIRLKRQAGAASRIDELSAHQQVLSRRRELRQSQADLAGALRSLSALSGLLADADLSIPFDAGLSRVVVEGLEKPTFLMAADPLADLAQALRVNSPREFDDAHPSLSRLSESVEAARRMTQALRSGYGPTVQVTGKLSRDYPNGPVLESFNQKAVGVSASWPLFEGGKTRHETLSQTSTAESLAQQQAQTLRDLKRDFETAQTQLTALRYQDEINRTAASENETLSQLVYEAYRAGRSTYLEVENANLRWLQARVQLVRTQVEILMQVSVLDSLSKPQNEKARHDEAEEK